MFQSLLIRYFYLDVHYSNLLAPSVVREFLCPDIVIIDSRCVQCLPQRSHHFRWASDVVNRTRKITDVFREHRFGDVPSFAIPMPA